MDSSGSDQAKRRLAIALNVLVPGTGLILLRREWLGAALAGLYIVLLQIALSGLLLLPAVVPAPTARLILAAAAGVWLASMRLVVLRARQVLGKDAAHELTLLLDEAARAVEERRYADARDLLTIAMTHNDEDVRVRLAWAQLMTVTGQFRKAKVAWECVLRLDRASIHRAQAVDALERLPAD